MVSPKKWIEELGRVIFILTIIEYFPIYICLVVWLKIENFFSRTKRKVLVRSIGHWETLNFILRLAYKLCGIDIEVEKSIDNDLDEKPCIFMSTHASILDIFTIL